MAEANALKITITLPPDMLAAIEAEVERGAFGSRSEVIRDAMRLWQQQEEERRERLALIRARLEQATHSGDPVTLADAFSQVRAHHMSERPDANDAAL